MIKVNENHFIDHITSFIDEENEIDKENEEVMDVRESFDHANRVLTFELLIMIEVKILAVSISYLQLND